MFESDVVPPYAEVMKRSPKGSVQIEKEANADLKRRIAAIKAKRANKK